MLEVHAPHETVHSWRDFFIHIATIVVGLMIAVGLEQCVEYFHNRHLLHQTRSEVLAELKENTEILARNTERFHKVSAQLAGNLALLRAAQQSPHPQPLKLDYSSWIGTVAIEDGAWLAAKQNGTLSLMPYKQIRSLSFDYEVLASVMTSMSAMAEQMELANAIASRSADGTLLPVDIQELIAATSACQAKLSFTTLLMGFVNDGLALDLKMLD